MFKVLFEGLKLFIANFNKYSKLEIILFVSLFISVFFNCLQFISNKEIVKMNKECIQTIQNKRINSLKRANDKLDYIILELLKKQK